MYREWRKKWRTVSLPKDLVEKVTYLLATNPDFFTSIRIRNVADFVEFAVLEQILGQQEKVGVDVFKLKNDISVKQNEDKTTK